MTLTFLSPLPITIVAHFCELCKFKSSSPQPACHTHVCQPVASLSIPPLKSFSKNNSLDCFSRQSAHVPYRETFSDSKKEGMIFIPILCVKFFCEKFVVCFKITETCVFWNANLSFRCIDCSRAFYASNVISVFCHNM